MTLQTLNILNYRNIRQAALAFSPKINCLVGLNGQGKTNVLDAIYLLSFTKSALTATDSLNITHGEQMAMVQGVYDGADEPETISCGLKRGVKKQFRRGRKDYKRMLDHIGLLPLVLVSPADNALIEDGSEERRRFMDTVICQYDKTYLEQLTDYNALLRQRNALLKHLADRPDGGTSLTAEDEALLEVLEIQMTPKAQYVYQRRTAFIETFVPLFQELYARISNGAEVPELTYVSQLQNRDLQESYRRTRPRDIILGWTSQGIHKDELSTKVRSINHPEESYPLKQVGSQGQQKTYLLAMKLAQALFLYQRTDKRPILLLDDIFDKLDSERVRRIVELVRGDLFGQIFITDTDRQHLTEILQPDEQTRIFRVEDGKITQA